MWSSSSSSSSDGDDENIIIRRRRIFRPRINNNFMAEYEYNEWFRMNSVKLEYIVSSIGHLLVHHTNRNHALSHIQQVNLCLHFLGSGTQYHSIGDMHGVSKATVCRVVRNVTKAINEVLFPQLVRFPNDLVTVVPHFHSIASIPLVVGCVDGTVIKIDAPSINEPVFVDRHGNHSVTCTAVCGPTMQFYYVNANWPGSVHDARVLRNISLWAKMESDWRPIENGIILGDSAYPLRDWLIPPTIRNPNDAAELSFVRRHKKTRRIIENAFGILKGKFPCLNYMRLGPELTCNIFQACTALCNLARENDEDIMLEEFEF
ncbi:unnamed protein product [Macrosiphum euphorbiae]|uniref:Putative nuclease HARBI1 n=1 Tax=Macrosiphum euphorbiae TaxID=13131 RepID=A0AAV0WI82_9HEMI|nr:unnamed protein product [Macrosiphum euphorbiae]